MEAGRTPVEAPPARRQPLEHSSGVRNISGVGIGCPLLKKTSLTLAMTRAGLISSHTGSEHLLELLLDGSRESNFMDFRPDLPLVLRW
jgi:hypothetical protein